MGFRCMSFPLNRGAFRMRLFCSYRESSPKLSHCEREFSERALVCCAPPSLIKQQVRGQFSRQWSELALEGSRREQAQALKVCVFSLMAFMLYRARDLGVPFCRLEHREEVGSKCAVGEATQSVESVLRFEP